LSATSCSTSTTGPVKFCWDLQKTELTKVINAPWPEASFIIYHYARSLEKFTLKQRSWKQHVNAGYDISRYFERSHGWTFDNTALRYACQTRHVIANITGQRYFARRGNWIRRYELGRNSFIYRPSLPEDNRWRNTKDIYINDSLNGIG